MSSGSQTTDCRNQMILGGIQAYPRSCLRCGLGPCKEGIADPFKPQGSAPHMGSGVQPPRTAMGCICPPGANLQCENQLCPRKPIRPLSALGTVCA